MIHHPPGGLNPLQISVNLSDFQHGCQSKAEETIRIRIVGLPGLHGNLRKIPPSVFNEVVKGQIAFMDAYTFLRKLGPLVGMGREDER